MIRINPNHYNARYNLGELFRMEGKFDEDAERVTEFYRDHGYVKAALGQPPSVTAN